MQSGLWDFHIQQRRVLLGAEGVVLADAALQAPGRAAQGKLVRQRGIKEHVGDREREGSAGAHHRVRREPVGRTGGQHDSAQQGPDRVPAYVRDGDGSINPCMR